MGGEGVDEIDASIPGPGPGVSLLWTSKDRSRYVGAMDFEHSRICAAIYGCLTMYSINMYFCSNNAT